MSEKSHDEIGERVRIERARRRLRQRDLAAAAGVTRETIGRLERGGLRPHRATLAAIGRALDLDLTDASLTQPETDLAS